MWVRNQIGELVNLEQFSTLRAEDRHLIIRNGTDHQTLMTGELHDCLTALNMIADGITMNLPLIDLLPPRESRGS